VRPSFSGNERFIEARPVPKTMPAPESDTKFSVFLPRSGLETASKLLEGKRLWTVDMG
jgi:hypothetical protein